MIAMLLWWFKIKIKTNINIKIRWLYRSLNNQSNLPQIFFNHLEKDFVSIRTVMHQMTSLNKMLFTTSFFSKSPICKIYLSTHDTGLKPLSWGYFDLCLFSEPYKESIYFQYCHFDLFKSFETSVLSSPCIKLYAVIYCITS